MNRKERQANGNGAFALNPRYLIDIKDKTILLVDDVLTPGAPVNECACTLLGAGAKAVNVLTLACVKGVG